MKIKELKLTNFRQFKGENNISFGTDNQNITLILGLNGSGKTSIFRAIMFVLYGDTQLEQDGDSQNIHLVNLDMLNENNRRPVKASVQMSFEFENRTYQINREITSVIKENDRIITQSGSVNLGEITSDGDFKTVYDTNNEIDEFVSRILNKNVREFFFFDAEKMTLLDDSKSAREMAREIKNGIINLLQIDNLNTGIDLLSQSIREKNREIADKTKDGNYEAKINDQSKKTEEIKRLEDKNDNLSKELKNAKHEQMSISSKLNENQEIKELFDQKESEEKTLLLQKEVYATHKKLLNKSLPNLFNLLGLDLLEAEYNTISSILEKKSDRIPLELIKESLNNCKCAVCQSTFNIGSTQELILKKLETEFTNTETTPILNTIINTRLALKDNKDSMLIDFNENIESTLSNAKEIEKLEYSIERLKIKIGTTSLDAKDLRLLQESLSNIEKDIEKLTRDIEKTDSRVEILRSELYELDKELLELAKKHKHILLDRNVLEKLSQMKEILESVTHEYTIDSSALISKKMTNTFKKLIDEKDKHNFNEVVINDNFEIQLLDHNGINRVQDLSMGQSQIFTLSFILSLASIASRGRSEVNFPLFMDTPFARLSGNNRDNLIKNIPELTEQWILLLTDTELTKVELELFEKSKRVGKIYNLNNFEGQTIIEEKKSIYNLEIRG